MIQLLWIILAVNIILAPFVWSYLIGKWIYQNWGKWMEKLKED